MRLTEKELREAWRRLTARPRADRSSCIAPDHLWMVAQGRLDGDTRSQVAAHLARCSDCSREVQLVGSLGEFAVTHGSELLARRVRRGRVAGRAETTTPSREPRVAGPGPSPFGGLLAWVSGALLLLLLITAVWAFTLLVETSRLRDELDQATSGRGEILEMSDSLDQTRTQLDALQQERSANQRTIAELEERVVRLGAPIIDPVVVSLDLRRVERTGDSFPRQEVPLPAAARWFTLAVTLPELPDAPSYTLQLQNARGEEVWRRDDVELAGRSFSISFPTELLRRGIFHLRLLTRGETGTELLEHIPLEITSG